MRHGFVMPHIYLSRQAKRYEYGLLDLRGRNILTNIEHMLKNYEIITILIKAIAIYSYS